MRLSSRCVEQNPQDPPVRTQQTDFVDKQFVDVAEARAERFALMFARRGPHALERIGKLMGFDPFASLGGGETLGPRRCMFGA
jgi:hypothetical protein